MKYYSKSSMVSGYWLRGCSLLGEIINVILNNLKSETEDDYSSHGPDRFARRTYGNKGRKQRANVLFADDMNESLHHYHRAGMRDISFHEYDREARLLNAQRNGEMRMGANPYLKHRDIDAGVSKRFYSLSFGC